MVDSGRVMVKPWNTVDPMAVMYQTVMILTN